MTTNNTLPLTSHSDNQTAVSPIALETIPSEKNPTGKNILNGNLKIIGDVKVNVRAVIGDTSVSVAELFALREGSTLKLDVTANAPIDLYLDNKLIARGELVVVEENFGINITHIEAEAGLD